ncbi:MYG1 protein C27H6.8 [Onthophagus taurus]|uniref:MYG1 protein C27H6.8 n=1 Tax=Onthophagus taurus TaxID=166361 RepID=UPI0039BEBBD3
MFKFVRMATFSENVLSIPAKLVENIWNGFNTMANDSLSPRVLKRIGTHDGIFHCDEALACFMLKQLPEYEDAEIIRTRDPNVLGTCDIVVDVGHIYDPKLKRFDHHQRDFEHTLSTIHPEMIKNKTITLSSAGLIYAHYGMEILSEIFKNIDFVATTECLKCLYLGVYDGFIEEIDAIDNGVPLVDGITPYKISTHLSARVSKLNPAWNSTSQEKSDELFLKAMALTGREFIEKVVELATIWWPGREIVKTAILNRFNYHTSGEVIKLERRCPWQMHLLALEKEMGIDGEIKFVIFEDASGSWRIQAIPIAPDSFICRLFLHLDWRGLRDEQLSKVANIDGCIFVHSSGFIGGNNTEDGALKMGIATIKAGFYPI